MSTVFEDEFMDVQAGLISLCLEVTEEKVDKVYAYCSNEKGCKMFNAFFAVDGQIKMVHQLGVPDELVVHFLKLGTGDIVTLDNVCKKHKRPAPTELKLYYDVKTGKFNADYKYEEVCPADSEIDSVDVFHEWMEEIKAL